MYIPIRWQQRFQNYEKAFFVLKDTLDRTMREPEDRLLQAGCLQAYEFTVELGWKTLKDYLEEKGILALNPTDTIRHAFQQNYIQDAELWMEALKARNLMSHPYNQAIADEILANTRISYFPLLISLYELFKGKL